MPENTDLEQRMKAWRRADPEPPGSSVTDEELADLVCGELDETQRMAIADRLLGDPDAAERYRLLRELHDVAQHAGTVGREESGVVRRIPRWALSLAATVAIVLGGAGLWRWQSQPVATMRAGDASSAVHPVADAELNRAPERLEWIPATGAHEATVRLMDAEAALLWESPPVAGTAVDLPDEAIRLLAEGGDFVWTVAVSGAGRRSELGPFWFSVRPATVAIE